ncbi:tensin-1 isoform X4 [Anopheles moucheti]|uniref:tensin-1 isoform X4 n=1 Tax=Anopheles moucheti TaxID=186751 RepID=UPI0022F01F9E|nr:tensin-1 isoform X4 [Anopheles moucheti]
MIRVNSQSFSLSSTLKKNGREEEQQAINKYNSLPLNAINAQQQQQQQPRPTTNLNHVNNNHYHNYSHQPYYNRQPQQQQQQQHHSYPVTRIAEEPSPKTIRLNYVAERILASTLPARQLQNGSSSPHATNGTPAADEHERELIDMLEQKYKQNYRILDLESRLVNITLEKLCELCKYIDSWLGSGKEKIVVLQDREDKHRLGTAVAAYLQYQKICGSNIPQASGQSKNFLSPGGTDNGRKTPTWLDLDIYSMQKFLESVTGPLRIPSHKRYIQYFSGLLSGVIKLNSSCFFLKAIRVESPPCLHYRAITVNSEWRSFIKIFEGVRCLFTSDIYVIPLTTRHFIYEIKHPLRLRGDILVRCYQIIPNNNMASYEKELIASVQFHTCAITEKEVQFHKGDLDLACQDERYSTEHMMTFCFDTVPNDRPMVLIMQDPLVRKEPIVENGDQLETINEDDRHRELDDLLSDMMLTVQGIPDVGQKADQTDHHQAQQRQQPHHHHHHQNPNDHFVNTNTDTIKRSHSAQLPVAAREDNRSRTPLTVSDYAPSVAAAAKERELLMYETSSTTTTLTPPPSESGRETPLLSAYASVAIRERELQNINNNNLTPAERELIMSVQRHPHQSLAYPRPARSTTGASERFTSDDDDELLGGGSGGQIPYHAREDSRPFTYGNIPASGTPQHPPAATMIKMQSGLSSPSMVRKALGTPTAARKTATLPRNDFEEMLRERREKVLSEKYTIGDQSPGGMGGGMMVSDTINNNSGGDGRWTYQQHHTVKTVTAQGATPNGYPAHEPLKRSNTMDGSFGRQFSNEGISGQSWLQLQQQKLRARREQQRREHSNSFSYNYGSPAFPTGEHVYNTTHRRSQTLSPVRNERNYHTLTTTRTHSTERPFVAVQRAHENAKLQTIGNAPLSILNASPHGHIAQAQTQASSPSPTVSSPSPASPPTTTSVSITNHHHHHQTVNGSGSAASSPVNGQAHATPQQHRHINGNGVNHYQQQQQHLNNSSLNGSSGLLSLAEQDHSTPKHGQVRLESEQIIFSNIHSLNNLDNCEKLNNLLNEITNSAAAVASVATPPEPQPTGTQTAASAGGGQACVSPNITTASVTTNSSPSSSMSTSNNSASLIHNHTHHLIDTYHDHQHPSHQYCHRNGRKVPTGDQEPMDLSSPDGSVDEKPVACAVNGERRNGHDTGSVTVIGHGQLALDKLLASLALESDVTEEHLAKIEGRTDTNGCCPVQRPTGDFHPSRALSDVLANLAEYDLTEMQRNGGNNLVDTTNGNYRLYPAHGLELVNGYTTLSNGHHHLPGQLQRSTSRSSNDATVAHQSHQQQQSQNSSPNVQQQQLQQQHHHHNHPHHPLLMNNHVRRIASETDSTISSISPSLSERSNAISWCDQAREESFSSYRSETEPDNSPMGGSPRPETPAFPVTPRTPYGLSNGTSSPALPPKSPTSQRRYNSAWSLRSQKSSVSTYDVSKDLFSGNQRAQEIINQNETLSCYTSRRNSTTSNANSEPQEVAPQFVKFARDSSKYWYKPNISREEAIALLRNAAPGTFIVRDSTTFANAYGLVVKVNHPPPGVQYTGPNSEELVRHFLVEPTIRGVRLKGCANEPVFTSLSALVYQHSITPLALPCRLIIPDMDLQQMENQTPAQQQLLQQGAACNVLYLFTCDTESLTGPQAIRKAVSSLLALRPLPKPTQVHFKASLQGITLTDNTRQLFFRRHYPSNNVSFCALDPDDRRWSIQSTTGDIPASKRMFAFVAKRSPSSADNQCHVFCELEPTQPAAAIIQFANKVLTGTSQQPAVTRAI